MKKRGERTDLKVALKKLGLSQAAWAKKLGFGKYGSIKIAYWMRGGSPSMKSMQIIMDRTPELARFFLD